ncbi:MAG: endonuclease MutS2 [Candidatus Rifleibacteriota bacterium]
MEQKSLSNLEFEKILRLISEFAGSKAAQEQICAFHPMVDEEQIQECLSEIDEYLDYSEAGVKISIGGIRDLRYIFSALHNNDSVLEAEDFIKVKADLEVMAGLKKTFSDSDSSWVIKGGEKISRRINQAPSLKNITQRIEDCLDDQGNLKAGASPALNSIRRDYSRTQKEIEKQLNAYISSHSDDVQDNFFTIRNDRYVIPVQASGQSRIQGIVHDQSASGQTVFIEPLAFLPMNNRLAQLKLSEREEIKRIFRALTQLLVKEIDSLENIFALLVWLDVIKAKVEFAIKYDAGRPEISKKGRLLIKEARHPLLHPECVPLDIEMNEKLRAVIITGPNGGGKTVALKTLGINSLLMQTGNYVLARNGSELPVFDQVFADIGESQSIENHLSTFTSHLQRLKEILEFESGKWLVLIDEICVGTDPMEGGALATGILKEFYRRGAFCLVTSHYDSLKRFAFTAEGFCNASMEFDYENFKPTFRFNMGLPGRSNALAMARVFALPNEVLVDLIDLQQNQKKDEKDLIEAIERERYRAESLRRTYVRKINEIRSREAESEKLLKQLREFRKTRRDRLTEEFTEKHRKKLKELERIISKLKKQAETTGAASAKEPLDTARKALSDSKKSIDELEKSSDLNQDFESTAEKISCSDQVLWKRNMAQGEVKKLIDGGKRAEIDFDGMVFNLPVSELKLKKSAGKNKVKKKQNTGSVYVPRNPVKGQVDLRGMRVEEALLEVESYLQSAAQSGLPKVFLVHGKGTGALQRAITEFLQSGPYRKKFRPGRYGEGDSGVTVVVFNEQADEQDRLDELEKRRTPGR